MEDSHDRSICVSRQNIHSNNRSIFTLSSGKTAMWESTKLVLDALKDIFSDLGIPEAIISDNEPCYKSQEFNSFCAKFEINHITGASYNHQANSIAERMTQTIK